jgi:hypothetical protein
MTEYWTDTDIPKSTDNAFNCVPQGTDKPKAKRKANTGQKKKLEKRILRENKYQFRPLDFCVHIATREESDRTLSIRSTS